MGRTPLSTIVGFNAAINYSDIRADLPKIACPTLVITTDESGLASVEETRAWQQTIRDSELLVIPGNSYHVAASHPRSEERRVGKGVDVGGWRVINERTACKDDWDKRVQ